MPDLIVIVSVSRTPRIVVSCRRDADNLCRKGLYERTAQVQTGLNSHPGAVAAARRVFVRLFKSGQANGFALVRDSDTTSPQLGVYRTLTFSARGPFGP
jgi:hypothetical protein